MPRWFGSDLKPFWWAYWWIPWHSTLCRAVSFWLTLWPGSGVARGGNSLNTDSFLPFNLFFFPPSYECTKMQLLVDVCFRLDARGMYICFILKQNQRCGGRAGRCDVSTSWVMYSLHPINCHNCLIAGRAFCFCFFIFLF